MDKWFKVGLIVVAVLVCLLCCCMAVAAGGSVYIFQMMNRYNPPTPVVSTPLPTSASFQKPPKIDSTPLTNDFTIGTGKVELETETELIRVK